MSKTSPKSPATKAQTAPPLMVLGFDEDRKPRGARFIDANPDLVAKAAELMGLRVYAIRSPEVAEVAKALPVGRLYAAGRGFVPNIRQSVYSDVVYVLADDPQIEGEEPQASQGLPESWDKVGPGHLVLAQEPGYVWCEAVVLSRDGDMLTLQYRDYPNLPIFPRHYGAVALLRPSAP
jgi:hypothetical protein